MTVSELIEKLKTFPQEAVIIIADEGEGISWIMNDYESPVLEELDDHSRKYNDQRLNNITQVVTFK